MFKKLNIYVVAREAHWVVQVETMLYMNSHHMVGLFEKDMPDGQKYIPDGHVTWSCDHMV